MKKFLAMGISSYHWLLVKVGIKFIPPPSVTKWNPTVSTDLWGMSLPQGVVVFHRGLIYQLSCAVKLGWNQVRQLSCKMDERATLVAADVQGE